MPLVRGTKDPARHPPALQGLRSDEEGWPGDPGRPRAGAALSFRAITNVPNLILSTKEPGRATWGEGERPLPLAAAATHQNSGLETMGGDHSGGDCPELADRPRGIGTLAEALQEVGGGSAACLR